LLPWRGQRIPLIDVATLVHGRATERSHACRFALVLAWQAEVGALSYGAIALRALPQTIEVANTQRRPLPDATASADRPWCE